MAEKVILLICFELWKRAKWKVCLSHLMALRLNNLPDAKKSFTKFESANIYAIYKRATDSVLSQIYSTDLECVNYALSVRDKNPLLSNSIGRISFSGSHISPPGEKLRPLLVNSSSTPALTTSKPAGGNIGGMFGGSSKSVPAKQQAEKKAAVVSQARSFFDPPAGSKAKSKSKKAEESSVQKESEVSSAAPIEDRDEDNEDGEWGSTYVPNKDNIKNRPIAAGAPQGTGGMHQSDVVFSDADEESADEGADKTPSKRARKSDKVTSSPTPPRSSKRLAASAEKKRPKDDVEEDSEEDGAGHKGKRGTPTKKTRKGKKRAGSEGADEDEEGVKMSIHGAMDDFMEDAAKKATVSGSGGTGKPKKKRLVEKVRALLLLIITFRLTGWLAWVQMFADEKGYLVTEMVWEEVSDDEADEAKSTTKQQPVKAQHSAPKTVPAPTKKAAAPTSKDASLKSQQKSMMSFFTKK